MEYYQIIILTFVGIFASSSAILSEKPDVIEVTDENQEEFALPLGTKLALDNRTKLYTPPPLARNFTRDNRMEVQWFNKKTRYNYCKVGATAEISAWGKWMKLAVYNWCRDKDGEDMCCGTKKCSCNWFQGNCACVSSKQFDYYEEKKLEDLETYLFVANEAADVYFETTAKPKDDDEKADEKAVKSKDGGKKADEKAEKPKDGGEKADEKAEKPKDGGKKADEKADKPKAGRAQKKQLLNQLKVLQRVLD